MSPLAVVILLAMLACGIVWAILGRTAWWIPAFALSFLGGFVNAGFKIYPHEVGLAMSLVAVVPAIAAAPRRLVDRASPDWGLYLLLAYMLVHLAVSSSAAIAAGVPGTGTIVRHYANGLWALVFAVLFWAYGDLRHLRVALGMATVFCVIRVAFGLVAVYRPETAAAPAAAFFVPAAAATASATDLRVSAPALMALLTVWFYERPGAVARLMTGAAYVAAIWLTLLGASRVAALSAFAIPFMWAGVQRQRAGLLIEAAAVAALVVALNYSPSFYSTLPEGARRSLSTFVVTPVAAVGEERAATSSSNSWHFLLLESGLRRWTAGPATFLVGTRVEGWRPEYAGLTSFDARADVAVRLAAYESAFLTIAATLGLVGLFLFARVLYWLYRPFSWSIVREGIRNRDDALALIAVQSLVIYVGACVIAGGYPSDQIVLGSLAAVAWRGRAGAAR